MPCISCCQTIKDFFSPRTASAILTAWSPIRSKLLMMSTNTIPACPEHLPSFKRRICFYVMIVPLNQFFPLVLRHQLPMYGHYFEDFEQPHLLYKPLI